MLESSFADEIDLSGSGALVDSVSDMAKERNDFALTCLRRLCASYLDVDCGFVFMSAA